jgi:surface protein
MKPIIIVKDRTTLKRLIDQEIADNGNNCDLNHIDISQVSNINMIFAHIQFNGDISKWDTSNVTEMRCLFLKSSFNGDISAWNVSKVNDMNSMFADSKFNRDISNWDVSSVTDMNYMFQYSKFNQDLSNWKPFNLYMKHGMFDECNAPCPYWLNFDSKELREKAIEAYWFKEELNKELSKIGKLNKKIKI